MPDPKVQAPSEFQQDVARNGIRYENPRGLPQAWVDHYLQRDRGKLAVDVMRAFDQNYDQQRQLDRATTKIWVLTLVVGGQAAAIGVLIKILLPLLPLLLHAR